MRGATQRVRQAVAAVQGLCIGADGVKRRREDEDELNDLAVSTFRSPGGQKFLSYLRSITIHNLQGPGVTDNELRHMEGQRYIVALMERRIENGRRLKPTTSSSPGGDSS